ncbi:fluoride efflux transporter CrcB [Neobacillus sp. MM2021_6]|uniref:fluoride efflux transporter CrcB n=1 Tax=Bacillaceae TaxID=186817 RepID=UPI001408AB76|nr:MULTISPECIES: fluoride efflux transporter CrcB [Bacillaceae]MBO0960213.1 fluoride efflux transporter CrcB [Neobacillus sp. MM2021_6]NHC18556.1 fluoride efflux transporter CrcB [Bacillus sp. MM2020_4]
MKIFAVGIGGFFGAIVRFMIGHVIPPQNGFPLGTLIINLIGCFFLAWFFTKTAKRWRMNPNLKLAIGTGFTGAFTTFSTFSVETMNLLQTHRFFIALFYVLVSVLGGIVLALLGAKVASQTNGGVE